jgi:hypothetical protein
MSGKLSRRDILKTGVLATTAAAIPSACQSAGRGINDAAALTGNNPLNTGQENFRFRATLESLSHPYWNEARGNSAAAEHFWDRTEWAKRLGKLADKGYNAIIFMCNPWLVHQWQTWLIPHHDFPEARDITPEQNRRVIEHVRWIMKTCRELGLQNFMMDMHIVTSPAFARAHGLDKDMPPSESVDWRHNYEHKVPGGPSYDKMIHWGVRNELTRAFTESALTELFQTYPDLDGLWGHLGEALPGRRSAWFKEAILPGLKRSGRKPIYILFHWMTPLEDVMQDIILPGLYENIWIGIEHNGEIICDTKPDPISVRWAEKTGLPVVIQYVAHNMGPLPWDSPRYAWEMLDESSRIRNCVGYLSHVGGELFPRALTRYGKRAEPYTDDPWVDILEDQFGEREAARHFLNAINFSAGITPSVNEIAWCPHDGRCTSQLMLHYWHWTDADERFSNFAGPTKGATLLPVRHYARVVAQQGIAFRDNNGSDYKRELEQSGPVLHGHPGAQELIWGHIDYQVTPEMHMRTIRGMGDAALNEAEEGLKTVRENQARAQEIYNQMKAYKLLTEYYEKKVLTAISALIYGLNLQAEEKKRALGLADETAQLYTIAANHIYDTLDNRSGNMKGGWWDESSDLPGLIEMEKKERDQLPELFKWPEAGHAEKSDKASLGTTARSEKNTDSADQ